MKTTLEKNLYAAVERVYINLAEGGEEFTPEEWEEAFEAVKDKLLSRLNW